MKHNIFLIVLLFGIIGQAQNVLEYSYSKEVEFQVYSESENKLRKIKDTSNLKFASPEDIARNYFFATSNKSLSTLYVDKEHSTPKDVSHFKNIINTPTEDMYVQLLHKTTYNLQGIEMCYIMFIARIKGINFPFPTLLSLTRIDNKWLIHNRANQQKISDCLMMFKPCVLSNLIEGKSEDSDITKLINKTRSIEGGLDFDELFNQLVIIQNNKILSIKLTMSKNMDCVDISNKETVRGQNYVTDIFKNTGIKYFKEPDELLISKVRQNNDSIVLTSELVIDYSNKKYHLVKFNRIKANGDLSREVFRLDENVTSEKPVKELIFLFENLNSNIFSDLSPRLNETPIMKSTLYKESRGVYEVLNITKLYNLFISKNDLFSSYLYK